ncbi:uncharacterized protein LOC131880977, partial [Tigriopus californicus]|uniref:uncharacterized protein LOC131880977 n=1 Tax=Tigriopus californicus TaxID=6832 RepID=UPI0027DA8985
MGATKELALINLLVSNDVDVLFVTEAELEPEAAACFAVRDYVTFLPPITLEGQKVRVLALVKSVAAIMFDAKLRVDLCTTLAIWLEFSLPKRSLFGGVYRPWSGLAVERLQLEALLDRSAAATAEASVVVLTGDLNLDVSRVDDKGYHRHSLLTKLLSDLTEAGLEYIPTGPTWVSHGTFQGFHRTSTIDHTYVFGASVTVTVLPDSTS